VAWNTKWTNVDTGTQKLNGGNSEIECLGTWRLNSGQSETEL